jgi:hypothetical protein
MNTKTLNKADVLKWWYGDKTSLYDGMRQCKTKREGQSLAIFCYRNGLMTRQGVIKWLQYIKGWHLPLY